MKRSTIKVYPIWKEHRAHRQKNKETIGALKRTFFIILSFITAILASVENAASIEPANAFVIQDIKYQSVDGAAKVEIETNEHVDYVIYALENPYRIIIDPLDTVWCDFESAVYFDEGMVRAIKFVKGKEMPDGPGGPYYPFDFVTVELRNPLPYELSESDYIITLNIGEMELLEPDELPAEKINRARAIGEEFAREIEEKIAGSGAQIYAVAKAEQAKKAGPETLTEVETERERPSSEVKGLLEDRKEINETKKELMKERIEIKAFRDELSEKKKDMDFAKDELNKKTFLLETEKVKLAKEKELLKKKAQGIKKNFTPRPIKDIFDIIPPEDYLQRELALEECVQIAMQNSIAIKIARERVESSRMKMHEAFRELFPELSFVLESTKGMISNRLYRGGKFGVEFKQVIFHGGEQMYLWKQSEINMKLAKENLNKEKEELIYNVSKAYYELAKAISKYDFQKRLVEDIKPDFDIARKEYEYDLITQIDFMNIESLVNQAHHTLFSYENAKSLARFELNKEMNISINADIKIKHELEPKDIELDADECIELAFKYKPTYRANYYSAEVARFSEKMAESQTFPQIDIFGKYLKAAEVLEPMNSLKNYLKNERTLGAMVSLPLGPNTMQYEKKRIKFAPTLTTFGSDTKYDTDKLRLNILDDMARYSKIKDSSAAYNESLKELNKSEQEIYTEVHDALYKLAEAEIKIKNSLNNIDLYKKELEVAEVRKGLNEITFHDLIQAKAKIYSEKGAYTDAVGDFYMAIAQLNKSIGIGGYF